MHNHLLTVEDMSISRIERILEIADDIVENEDHESDLCGFSMANVFLEPSTRTRVSFDLAMKMLGGNVVNITDKEATSMAKGEKIEDTLCALSQIVDLITLRTESKILETELSLCDVPIINAGDGPATHPTQALVDLYTIRDNFPRLDRVKVLIIGDCKNSRAIHSFVAICLKFGMDVKCFSPKDLELQVYYHSVKECGEYLTNKAVLIEEDQLEQAIKEADVIYTVRFQKEREKNYHYVAGKVATNEHNYETRCGIKDSILENIKRTTIIMHPFPRGGELPKKFDNTRHAAYFQQMQNALYVRMAVIKEVLDA